MALKQTVGAAIAVDLFFGSGLSVFKLSFLVVHVIKQESSSASTFLIFEITNKTIHDYKNQSTSNA